MWPVRILHFPVRSFAQFKRRTEVAIFEGHYPDWGRFKRLRELYEQGRFEELYNDLVLDDDEVAEGIRAGRLVIDERLARLLPRCPDPLDGGESGTLRLEPDADDAERERRDLEFDAMQLLGRTSRWTTVQRDRNRERIESLQKDVGRATRQRETIKRKLQRRNKRLEGKNRRLERQDQRIKNLSTKLKAQRRRLKAERARPWSRMRRRIGRLLGRGR
jgi:hypothetical protein